MNSQTSGWLGKYRDLVIAIALFLLLDLGVLLFNIQATRQIEADTRLISAGGELRMYSQQLTKSLLTLQNETTAGLPNQTSMAQIAESHKAFGQALGQLRFAFLPAGPEQAVEPAGEPGRSDPEARERLQKLADYWEPLERVVAPLLATPNPGAVDVEIAATKFVGRNIRLTLLADDLTQYLETSAIERASLLRNIQLAAILLALLNFIFIVVKFVRRLRASDRVAEAAREQTARILGTVHEGLFLMARDGRIGEQRSASLDTLFGRPLRADENLRELLRTLVAPAVFEAAEQYIELLFNDRIRAALLEQLNPLHEVEIAAPAGSSPHPRCLRFEFEQVREAGRVAALLVTVFDVSERVRLARALANAEQRAKTEMGIVLGILDQDPGLLTEFVAAAQTRLEQINASLQTVRAEAGAYAELVERLLRAVHGLKGEATMLSLERVAHEAHVCEDGLIRLRKRGDLSGEDFIPVAVAINAIGEQVAQVKAVLARMRQFAGRDEPDRPNAALAFSPLLRQIEKLAQRVAADLNKRVRFEASVPELAALPEGFGRLFQEAAPQLVRNAVVHGIEPAEERVRAGKPAEGTVRVEIRPQGDGALSLVVRDDGRGISVPALRRRLVEGGFKPADEVERMDDQEIVAALFQTEVSTAEEITPHAGRGVGLNVVSDLASRVGARLHIASRPNGYTEFIVSMKA
jgi:HPt (histidine-containing phosphotransfer) domain-containing protein